MPLDPKILKAILSMDSYNRGYNEDIQQLADIGTAQRAYLFLRFT